MASPGLGPFRPKLRLVIALLKSMRRPSPTGLNRFMHEVMFDFDQVGAEEGPRWPAFMSYLGSVATQPAVKQTMRRLPRGNLGPMPEADLRSINIPSHSYGDETTPTRVYEPLSTLRNASAGPFA